MSELFDPPRWPGGPHICVEENLPAFKTPEELKVFTGSIRVDTNLEWVCKACGEHHFWSHSKPPKELLRKLKLLWIVTDAESDPIGKARQSTHRTNTTERFYDDENLENKIGAKAEIAFGRLSGIPVDTNSYLTGDGNVDFKVLFRDKVLTVDVKGARNPLYLFVKEKDIDNCATILVLAEVLGDEVMFLGWATRKMMRASPVRDFGYGIRNHYLPASNLRSMFDLIAEIVPQK